MGRVSSVLRCAALIGLAGCGGEATQVVACLYVEPGSRARAERLRVRVESLDGVELRRWDLPLDELALPARVPLVPGRTDGYRLTAELVDAAGPFSVQRVRGAYEGGALLAQRLFFYDVCADVVCDEDETCSVAQGEAVCVPWDRDGERVEGAELALACPADGGCPGCEGRCQSCVDGTCVVKADGAACGPCADDVCEAGRCAVRSPVARRAGRIAASDRHTCVVVLYASDDQGLFCFGDNAAGQLGLGTVGEPVVTPTREAVFRVGARHVGAGPAHTCFSVFDGPVYCVGEGDRGQLGTGEVEAVRAEARRAVEGRRDWTTVAAAGARTCALDDDSGAVRCWGAPHEGCPGPDRLGPVPIDDRAWRDVALGPGHACAIRGAGEERQLACWGDDTAGQVSGAPGASVCQPEDVGAPAAWEGVVLGAAHTCAHRGAEVVCFGSDAEGQLGDGPGGGEGLVELALPSGGTVRQLASGAAHTCAVDTTGQLYCWGANDAGQLGTGEARGSDAPTLVGADFHDVGAGARHTCATDLDGRLFCWGANDAGQLGTGDFEDRARPTRVCIPEMRR